jgi:hypothetical protein
VNADQQIAALWKKWADMPTEVLAQIEDWIREGRVTFDAAKDTLRVTHAGRDHVELNIVRGKPT